VGDRGKALVGGVAEAPSPGIDEVRQASYLLEIPVAVVGGDQRIPGEEGEYRREDASGVVDPFQFRLPSQLERLRSPGENDRF